QIVDGAFHEYRLVENDVSHQLLRHVDKAGKRVSNPIHDRDGVRVAALLHDRKVNGPLPVYPDDAGLDLVGVLCRADVAYQHRRLAYSLQRNTIDLCHAWNLAVGIEVVVERSDFDITGRQNKV